MPHLQRVDRRAIARAARGLAPMLRRRSGLYQVLGRADAGERLVRAMIASRLEAVDDDDDVSDPEDDILWCRVEASGLVLVGVADRAYIVARVAARGGRASRLLVR